MSAENEEVTNRKIIMAARSITRKGIPRTLEIDHLNIASSGVGGWERNRGERFREEYLCALIYLSFSDDKWINGGVGAKHWSPEKF